MFSNKPISSSKWLLPILSVVLLFTLFRIVFQVYNVDFLSKSDSFTELLNIYWVGLRYDLFIVLLFNWPLVVLFATIRLFRNHKAGLFNILIAASTLINGLLVVISVADIPYFRFNSRRATVEVFSIFGDSAAAFGSFLLRYWYFVLLVLVVWMLLFFINRKSYTYVTDSKSNSSWGILLFIIGSAFFIGFNAKQFNPKQASFYVASNHRSMATNTPQTLFYSLVKRQEILERKSYFLEEETAEIFQLHHQFISEKPFEKRNIFLFVLESFSQEYLIKGHPNKAPTPFLDSLLSKSLVFENTYANGATSAYGLMSILGGIPPFLDDAYFATIYGDNTITGVGNLLEDNGYTSSFFYGAEDDHYGFRKNMTLLGIDHYFSKEDYNGVEAYDGNWGIYDAPFMQYAATEIQKQPSPVFATIFNISSHLPYMVPVELKDKLPKGTMSSHQSLAYVDFAIEQFFEAMEHDSKFENSIFVFIADHWAKRTDLEYKNDVGRYRIPFFIYDPQQQQPQKVTAITQQLDVLPTILSYFNYSGPWMSFGNSALPKDILPNDYRFTFNEYENIFQIIDSAYVLAYDENLEKSFSLFQYKTDPELKENLLEKLPNNTEILKRKTQMEKYLKAVIQTYHNHLLDNDVNIEPKE